jgi:hypothetical protein
VAGATACDPRAARVLDTVSNAAPVMQTFPLAERLHVFEAMGELLDDIVLGSMPYAERPGSGERMILGGWAQAHTTFGAIVVES